MSQIDPQAVFTDLPNWLKKDLEECRKRCTLLLKSQSIPGNTVEEADWILEGILWHCRQTGVYVNRTFHVKRSGSFASFVTKSETVRELLTECAPNLTPIQYVALGQVAARELANFLGHPVSFNRMMQKVDLIPAALDTAYPGYLASKLIHLAVRYDNGQ